MGKVVWTISTVVVLATTVHATNSHTTFNAAVYGANAFTTIPKQELRCGVLANDPRHAVDFPWSDDSTTPHEHEAHIAIASSETILVVGKTFPRERRVVSMSDGFHTINKLSDNSYNRISSSKSAFFSSGRTNNANDEDEGRVSIYKWEGSLVTAGKWVLHSSLSFPPQGGYRECGAAVALYHSTIMVSCPFEDEGRGAVYVYEENQSGGFSYISRLTDTDAPAGAHFGSSIALKEHIAIIGAPGWHKGMAYAFYQSGDDSTVWYKGETFVPKSYEPFTDFGTSVALHIEYGNTIVAIGGPTSSNGYGAVGIYTQNPSDMRGMWAGQAVIEAIDGAVGDEFGKSVSLSSDVLVIGAPSHSSLDGDSPAGGAVYVFMRHETDSSVFWQANAKLAPHNLPMHAGFGSSTALIDNQVIIVGAPNDHYSRGAMFLFRRQATSDGIFQDDDVGMSFKKAYWRAESKMISVDGDEGDRFGVSVAASSSMVHAGVPGANGVISFASAPCPRATATGSKLLDLYIFLDKSASMEWYRRQCRRVQDGFSQPRVINNIKKGGMNTEKTSGFSCWELLANFVENLVHELQAENPHLKWEDGNFRVHLSAFSCMSGQRYPVTYEYLDLKSNKEAFEAAIEAMKDDDNHRGGTCPGQGLEILLSKVETTRMNDVRRGLSPLDRVSAGIVVTDGIVFGDDRIRSVSEALLERGVDMYGVAIFGDKVTARNYHRLVKQAKKITMITGGLRNAYQLGGFAMSKVARAIATSVKVSTTTTPTSFPTVSPTSAPTYRIITAIRREKHRTLENVANLGDKLLKHIESGGGHLADLFESEDLYSRDMYPRQLGGEFGEVPDSGIQNTLGASVWCGYGRKSDAPPGYYRRRMHRELSQFWVSDPSSYFESICTDVAHKDYCSWDPQLASCWRHISSEHPTSSPTRNTVGGEELDQPTQSPTTSPSLGHKFDCSVLHSRISCEEYTSLCFWHWNKRECIPGPLN